MQNAIGIYGAEELSTNTVDEDHRCRSHLMIFCNTLGWFGSNPCKQHQCRYSSHYLAIWCRFKTGWWYAQKIRMAFSFRIRQYNWCGQQTLSWIYYRDLIRAIDFLIERPDVLGAINSQAQPYYTARVRRTVCKSTRQKALV